MQSLTKQKTQKRAFNAQKSLVKLVIYVGDKPYVFYSLATKERKLNNVERDIATDMVNRLLPKFKDVKAIVAYDKNRDFLMSFTPAKSRLKLVVYDRAGNRKSYFSLPSEEAEIETDNYNAWSACFKAINNRVLKELYNGIYSSAMFIDNERDKEIFRITP